MWKTDINVEIMVIMRRLLINVLVTNTGYILQLDTFIFYHHCTYVYCRYGEKCSFSDDCLSDEDCNNNGQCIQEDSTTIPRY